MLDALPTDPGECEQDDFSPSSQASADNSHHVKWHDNAVIDASERLPKVRGRSASLPNHRNVPNSLAAPNIHAAIGMLRPTSRSSATTSKSSGSRNELINLLAETGVSPVLLESLTDPSPIANTKSPTAALNELGNVFGTMSLDDAEAKVTRKLSNHGSCESRNTENIVGDGSLDPDSHTSPVVAAEDEPLTIRNLLEMVQMLAVRDKILTRDLEEGTKLMERERCVYQDQISRLRATVDEQNQIILDYQSRDVRRLFTE